MVDISIRLAAQQTPKTLLSEWVKACHGWQPARSHRLCGTADSCGGHIGCREHQRQRKRNRSRFPRKLGKFMHDTQCPVAVMDAVCVNHCPAVQNDKAYDAFPPLVKATMLKEGLRQCRTIHLSSMEICLQHFERRHHAWPSSFPMTRRKAKPFSWWKSPKSCGRARNISVRLAMQMKKLPNALKAIIATDGGPTGR